MIGRRCLPLLVLPFVAGCAMLTSWRAIPPPGGCDRCHQVPLTADWQAVYVPATMLDEEGHLPWQRPQPPVSAQSASALEDRMLTEQPCFDCHQGPNRDHAAYKGRYHH